MLIINSGAHRFLSLWPSVQTYMDWTLFQASFLVVKRCLKPVRASWHKPLEAGVRGHAWQTQFQPQLHELGPVEVEPTGGFGGTGYWGQHPSRGLQQEPMLRSPSLEEVRFYRDRAFEPWWDVLLFPLFQDVSIAPPKLTDLPLRIQLSFWSCTCLGGNVSAHFFPTQNTCYLPLRELFSHFKSKARLLESTSLNRTSLCHL